MLKRTSIVAGLALLVGTAGFRDPPNASRATLARAKYLVEAARPESHRP